jgi:hypothetical protein
MGTLHQNYLKVSENGLSVVLAIRLSCEGALFADPAVLFAIEGKRVRNKRGDDQ